MSKMKELWYGEKECLICGKHFVPQWTQHKSLFTCTQQCEDETNNAYEDMHKAKEAKMTTETKTKSQADLINELVDGLTPIAKAIADGMPEDRKHKLVGNMVRKITNDYVQNLHTMYGLMGVGANFENHVWVGEGDEETEKNPDTKGLSFKVTVSVEPMTSGQFDQLKATHDIDRDNAQ